MYTPKCTSTNPHGVMIRIQNPTGWLNMDQHKQTSKVVPTKKRSGLLVLEMTSKICCEVVQYTVTRAHIDVVITSLNPKSLYCNQELTWFTSRVMRKNVWETEHLESYHLINSGKFGTLIRKKSGLIFVRRFVETIYIYPSNVFWIVSWVSLVIPKRDPNLRATFQHRSWNIQVPLENNEQILSQILKLVGKLKISINTWSNRFVKQRLPLFGLESSDF